MFVALEAVALCLPLIAVWVLFRASRARPQDTSMKVIAWTGLAVWAGFVLIRIINLDYLQANAGKLLRGVAIAAVLVGLVLGYRMLLAKARERAGRN